MEEEGKNRERTGSNWSSVSNQNKDKPQRNYKINSLNGYDHKNIDELFENVKLFKEDGKEKLDYYFESYSHFGIHEDMLKDVVRTKSYENAICKNPHLFKGKTVLDIGCGTGILSMFAARAGAKHVYGIEMAEISTKAKEIIKENGYDNRITVIKGKVEEIELPVEKVDIIISEWMGYFLLYEGMLDSVLYARDKWLNKGGLMFPDRAVIYLSAIEDEQYKSEKLGFWDNVYDLKMSCIKKWAKMEPLVDYAPPKALVTNDCPVLDIDLGKCTVADLDFSSEYTLTAFKTDYIHAYVGWFETYFSYGYQTIKLSTSMELKGTHWKQSVFYLDDEIPIQKGETVKGSIVCKKNTKNPRELDIKISYHFDQSQNRKYDNVQIYKFA